MLTHWKVASAPTVTPGEAIARLTVVSLTHMARPGGACRKYPESFQALQASGMQRNSSWDQAAQEYERVFGWAMADSPYCK